MSTTAEALINSALQNVQFLDFTGDATLTTTEKANALAVLNRMLAAWDVENVMIPATSRETFATVAGQGNRTIGSGGNYNTIRPVNVVDVTITDSEGTSHALTPIGQGEYDRIVNKTTTGRPTHFFYDPQPVLGILYFYPVPSAAETLTLVSLKPFQQFAAITDVAAFPDEWMEAIEYNLAVRLAPKICGTVTQEVAAIAAESKRRLKYWNAKTGVMESDIRLRRGVFLT